jgi:hypothetical protein
MDISVLATIGFTTAAIVVSFILYFIASRKK